jgi:HlyD family secretion protein
VKLQRKYAWYAGGMALTTLLVLWMLRPESVAVETATAAIGPLTATVGDEGQTRVRDRHMVTSPVPGRLERISLEVGDPVRPGMVVARLAPVPLDARSRQQAEAALAASRDLERSAAAAVGEARGGLEQARADRQRAERLVAGGGIAPAEVERLQILERVRERELEAAEGRASAAAHDVEAARSALLSSEAAPGSSGRTLNLTCPVGGRVLAIAERSARTVAPGEPLLEVGDPADLEVVVDLLSADAVKVEPGMPMLLSGWGGDSVLEGRVRRIEPSGFTKISALGVEEQRVNIVGDLVNPTPALGDRFRVDVAVVLWQSDSVLKVPSSALFRRGSGWALFVVEDGRARERQVTIGHESGTESEVLQGVAPGDRLIRHPTDQVRDGVRVTYVSSRS